MENGGKMENPGEIYQLCRLCLANNQVNVPIFGEKSDIRQISLKISSCLPIRIAVDDSLPKNICEGCSDKLELFYAFWNSSQEADKTLRAWIEQININNAGEAMAEVVKQISNSEGIPLIAEVKEETEELAEDDPDKVIINQPFDDDEDVDEKESEEAPPAKRAKLSPNVEEESGINQESDDHVDEEYDVDEVEPKVEDESDMSDSDEDAPLSSRLADMPGTSKDEEQAGPSGVGKDGEKFSEVVITISEEELQLSDVNESELLPETPTLKQNNIEKMETSKFECDQCSTSFKHKSSYDVHMKTHTKQRKYKCEQCPAVFYRKSSAEEHRKAHDEFKVAGETCAVCKMWFKNVKCLANHKRTHALAETRHKCDMCPETFQFIRYLWFHRATVHSIKGLLKCPCCEYTTRDNKQLLEHFNIHTKEKGQNICTTCDKVFSCYDSLQMHKERDHQPKKKFNCDLCSSVFDTSVGLKDHKKRHIQEQSHICKMCGKGFIFNSHLVRHMNSHSEDRNFECATCGNKYKKKEHLNRHLKTHDEVKKRKRAC